MESLSIVAVYPLRFAAHDRFGDHLFGLSVLALYSLARIWHDARLSHGNLLRIKQLQNHRPVTFGSRLRYLQHFLHQDLLRASSRFHTISGLATKNSGPAPVSLGLPVPKPRCLTRLPKAPSRFVSPVFVCGLIGRNSFIPWLL